MHGTDKNRPSFQGAERDVQFCALMMHPKQTGKATDA
jgi:hypothetical protein